MVVVVVAAGKLVPFAFGFEGRRCDGGGAGAVVEEEDEAAGNICIGGDVGEEPEGGDWEDPMGTS